MTTDQLERAEEQLRGALDAFLSAPAAGGFAPLEAAVDELCLQTDVAVTQCADLARLGEMENLVLRQKGPLNQLLRNLGQLEPSLRKRAGALANGARMACERSFAAARERLGASAAAAKPAFDVTLPGRRPWVGRPHLLMQVRDEIASIFKGMGYSVADDREVEDDHHNFGALNFAPWHPARDAHDTLFLEGGALLRTHTSSVQIRTMERQAPPRPLRMIFPGRVYRAEQLDATHASEFHQVEGLYVDHGVSMAHLKGALSSFARALFGERTRTRFRPSYFPFTEPSGEMDVSCFQCGGSGRRSEGGPEIRCNLCKGSGWIEILGCGMVHPNVFRAVGYDPEEWTGFAFGMGLERVTMLRHGVTDIRHFLENDVRFLEQF